MSITDDAVKYSFLAELHLIISDFEKILEYVDPSDCNLEVFSHRIYELLLRTCTAFETISKNILNDQSYTLPGKKQKMDIVDYFTLNDQYKLDEYTILLPAWRSGAKEIKPFSAWNSKTYVVLSWYEAYNHSKHNRQQNFKEANLENLLHAISGLFVLLFALYEQEVFGKYQSNSIFQKDEESGYIWGLDSIFSVKPPE